jgi:hypothetical protein
MRKRESFNVPETPQELQWTKLVLQGTSLSLWLQQPGAKRRNKTTKKINSLQPKTISQVPAHGAGVWVFQYFHLDPAHGAASTGSCGRHSSLVNCVECWLSLTFWPLVDFWPRNLFLIIVRVESVFDISFWKLCLDNALINEMTILC